MNRFDLYNRNKHEIFPNIGEIITWKGVNYQAFQSEGEHNCTGCYFSEEYGVTSSGGSISCTKHKVFNNKLRCYFQQIIFKKI